MDKDYEAIDREVFCVKVSSYNLLVNDKLSLL